MLTFYIYLKVPHKRYHDFIKCRHNQKPSLRNLGLFVSAVCRQSASSTKNGFM